MRELPPPTLEQRIKMAFDDFIIDETNKIADRAAAEIKEKIKAHAAQIAVNLASWMDVQRCENKLIITIKDENPH